MSRYFVSIFLFSAAIICVFSSCGEHNFFQKKNEGHIKYEVTFPFEENSLLLELFPKEMMLEFKGDQMHSTLKSSYGVVSTEFLIDNKKQSIIQLLKSFSDRYMLPLQGESVKSWLDQYPHVRIEYKLETDTIAGYLCKSAVAYFMNDSTPPIQLYYTKDIDLDHSNWWNQFQGIDGFLMGYDIEQYGKRMRLRAKEVVFEPVTDDRFQVPQGYINVDMDGMNAEMDKLVNDFMN